MFFKHIGKILIHQTIFHINDSTFSWYLQYSYYIGEFLKWFTWLLNWEKKLKKSPLFLGPASFANTFTFIKWEDWLNEYFEKIAQVQFRCYFIFLNLLNTYYWVLLTKGWFFYLSAFNWRSESCIFSPGLNAGIPR